MELSGGLIDGVKHFEGLRLVPYYCPTVISQLVMGTCATRTRRLSPWKRPKKC